MNDKRFVGIFHFLDSDLQKYYSSDNISFYDESGKLLTDKDLEDWAVWVNSPWSMVHEGYEIKLNCKDAYSGIVDGEPDWKCEYSFIGYDGIEASTIGYGDTPEQALESCKNLFDYLQKTYNPEGESV